MKIAALHSVSVDESGNTGEDLLSPQQPTFVLASTSLSDGDAVHLIESIGGHRDIELKYSKLRKSGKGRALIAGLLAALEPDVAKTHVINKSFMIVGKMVDILIEPLASETGFNLYGRGTHAALAEAWYQVFPAVLGEDRARVLLERFVAMCRDPTPKSITSFYSFVDNTRTGMPEMDSDLELIGLTRELVAKSMLSTTLSDGLDPAIPALFSTAIVWGEKLEVPFTIDHDEAAVIARWYPHLKEFLFSGQEPQVIGTGERSFTLPLLATEVRFVESGAHHAIQIADVLAGATRNWLDSLAANGPSQEGGAGETELLPFVFDGVWPTGEISPDETALESINPADEGAAFLAAKRALRMPE